MMVHFLKHSMKRKFHWEFLIFISSLMLLGTVQGRGQAVVLRGDTLMMDGDSLVHLVVPSYRGVLHWQESEQGVTWQDLEEEKGDTLTIRADREALYRGVVSEGSCEPLFTNTARVIHFPPEVMTDKVSDVGREEATVAGEVTADGGKPVTERGICYSLSHSPILFDHKVTAGSGTGTFTATLTGLTPDTIWHARAYAINVKGTAYGAEISFRTLPEATPPVVVTGKVSGVGREEATVAGEVTADGGEPVTERGICYSLSHSPILFDHKEAAGSGTGTFTATLTGLTPDTVWYARAYAINVKGTAYGAEISFRTLPEATPPVVVTGKVSGVGREEATVAGEVTADGGEPVTERGICYSLSHSPILFDHKEAAGSGTGTFTATLTGLTPDTVWYARAYAINVKGTAYGAEISFRTLPEADPETVTDIDGNTYPVVRVGNQLWMAENLRVTRAPDGQPVISYAYVGDPEREALYGRYYSWDAAMNGSRKESAQGICPDGWHLPSDEEVKQMEIALGMSRSEADIKNAWRGYGTGTKIKMGGSSGLEIPMAGMRHVNGSIIYNNDWAFLYTSSESGSYAWRRCFREASTGVGRFDTYPKTYGFSVRCIKDH